MSIEPDNGPFVAHFIQSEPQGLCRRSVRRRLQPTHLNVSDAEILGQPIALDSAWSIGQRDENLPDAFVMLGSRFRLVLTHDGID
jgi:hypothetical protein